MCITWTHSTGKTLPQNWTRALWPTNNYLKRYKEHYRLRQRGSGLETERLGKWVDSEAAGKAPGQAPGGVDTVAEMQPGCLR